VTLSAFDEPHEPVHIDDLPHTSTSLASGERYAEHAIREPLLRIITGSRLCESVSAADDPTNNPLQGETYEAVRNVLRDGHGLLYLYANKRRGEGAVFKNWLVAVA
jgi:hypothetical protein